MKSVGLFHGMSNCFVPIVLRHDSHNIAYSGNIRSLEELACPLVRFLSIHVIVVHPPSCPCVHVRHHRKHVHAHMARFGWFVGIWCCMSHGQELCNWAICYDRHRKSSGIVYNVGITTMSSLCQDAMSHALPTMPCPMHYPR